MMTLTELARLEAQATPGPWKAYCRDGRNPDDSLDWPREHFLQWEVEGPEIPYGRGEFYAYDAALIAAMRNALPALLAVAKAAREVADDLEVDIESIARMRAALDALEITK